MRSALTGKSNVSLNSLYLFFRLVILACSCRLSKSSPDAFAITARSFAARNIVPEVKEAIRNTEIPTASVKIRSVKLIKGMYLAISTA